MELVASLPTDWLAVADPTARGPAPLLAPDESDAPDGAVAAPFDRLLVLLEAPVASGEFLPVAGNPLPLPMAVLPAGAEAIPGSASPAAATALPRSPGELPSAPGLSRFELSAGLRAALPPASTVTPGAASPTTSPFVVDADASAAPPVQGVVPPPALVPHLRAAAPTAVETDRIAAASARAAAALESAAAGLAPSDSSRTAPRRAAATPARTEPAGVAVESRPAGVASAAALPALSAIAPTVVAKAMPREEFVAAASAGLPSVELDVGATGATTSPWSLGPTSGGVTSHTAAHSAPTVPQAPVDLRTPNWHEAFASRIQWLVDREVGEARIKLNPPELGAVDVKISLVDDKTYVQLTAASSGARDELAQSLPRLRELFVASGLELGGASVHGGRDGHAGRDSASRALPQLEELAGLGDGAESPRPARVSAGRIDVFA